MKTSSFLSALRTHAVLPLVFRTSGETISPGYHLTEVKRVTYETMDCGAEQHRWSESQFKLWAPATPDANRASHMAAGKFLQIVDRVEAELPLSREAEARVFASFDGQPAALYGIEGVVAVNGKLSVLLTPDRTRCKAAERRAAGSTSTCCGSSEGVAETEASAVGCGCGASTPETNAVACCT